MAYEAPTYAEFIARFPEYHEPLEACLSALDRGAGRVRERFTALAAGLAADPPLPGPAGSPLADAVAAVAASAAAAAMVPGVGSVPRWELAAAVTCGLLLAPSWPAVAGHASWPWAAAG